MKNIVVVDDSRCGNETIYSLNHDTLVQELGNFQFDGMTFEQSKEFILSCAHVIPVEKMSCDIEPDNMDKFTKMFQSLNLSEKEIANMDVDFIRTFPVFEKRGGLFTRIVELDAEETEEWELDEDHLYEDEKGFELVEID